MIVTETIARTLACPFAKDFNPENQFTPCCITNGCMSWDFTDSEYVYPAQYECIRYGWELPKEIERPGAYTVTEKQEQRHWDEANLNFNWFVENDAQMLAAGWEMTPPYKQGEGGTQTLMRWRRLRPDREGQCGRIVIISVDRD